ncbi:MAG: RNA methyltransferase [Bacteroidales bacterium]|nr:RNA methyltransferase [Bacteroidales bacterium]
MNSDFQLTNRLRKEFASLDDAKGRRRAGIFPAEGTKCVLELLAAFTPRYIFSTAEWKEQYASEIGEYEVITLKNCELKELSRLSATPPVIAFFELPEAAPVPSKKYFEENLVLALDRVQDPGNLGTILRTADWMGVHTVLASHDTVDAFNPKVVQATMGALARVNIVYTSLPEVLGGVDTPVYGTFLDGTNIYSSPLTASGVIVMGNEGSGISAEVAACVTRRLLIPPYPGGTVESLNVAVATAITLALFRAPLLK